VDTYTGARVHVQCDEKFAAGRVGAYWSRNRTYCKQAEREQNKTEQNKTKAIKKQNKGSNPHVQFSFNTLLKKPTTTNVDVYSFHAQRMARHVMSCHVMSCHGMSSRMLHLLVAALLQVRRQLVLLRAD
jgi:hypothetical protein